MTTNDATPREFIQDVMYSAYDYMMPDAAESDTDKIIAHLWQAADDWDDVQVKVAVMLEGEVKCDVAPDSYHAKLEEMTSEIVTALLTALIGPRPQGENDGQ